MAAEFDEKLAEAVRKFTCLFDKQSPDFKDKDKKRLCWNDVAEEVGVEDGEEAKRLFQNLRNRYSRDKKKVESKKVSGSSTDEVNEVKKETSDMYKYLTWLDPYVQPRKTSTNFIALNDSDDGELEDDQSSVTESVKSEHSVKSKPKYRCKRKRLDIDDLTLQIQQEELNAFKAIGESLKKGKESTNEKDEDQLFGDLLVAQLKSLSSTEKIKVKMEINNLIYRSLLPQSQPHSYSSSTRVTTMGTSIPSDYQKPVCDEMTQLDYGLPNYPPGYFFNRYTNKQL